MKGRDSNALRNRASELPFFHTPSIASVLTTLIDRLESTAVSSADVIPWGCPIPSFGNLSQSRVATLGLNPSNREFMDELGNELRGPGRRFHTLSSLGLRSWLETDSRHLRLILESCHSYFWRSPYDTWFKRLDHIVSGTKASYYDVCNKACHLDLIPYATKHKWIDLTSQQRSSLLAASHDTLSMLLRDSPVQVLILNGSSVVEHFQDIAGISFERQEMPAWSLPRRSNQGVMGVAYRAVVDTLSGTALERDLLILGYNHNLQSSYGVTTKVIESIRAWIAQVSEEVIC